MASQWPEVMHPTTVPFRPAQGWGNYRIEIDGTEIAFSDEDPGVQVIFEGELSDTLERQIVEEILSNIERTTGQRGRIIEL
jgi:hypothetical protein